MTQDTNSETAGNPNDDHLVSIVRLVLEQPRIGCGTMNDLLAAMRRYFTGLDGVHCVVEPRDWAHRNTTAVPSDAPRTRTNRQAHEEAAGMGLDDAFFRMNGIDPDAPHVGDEVRCDLQVDEAQEPPVQETVPPATTAKLLVFVVECIKTFYAEPGVVWYAPGDRLLAFNNQRLGILRLPEACDVAFMPQDVRDGWYGLSLNGDRMLERGYMQLTDLDPTEHPCYPAFHAFVFPTVTSAQLDAQLDHVADDIRKQQELLSEIIALPFPKAVPNA